MKRIMHVITGLATGGAEVMLLKLLQAASGDFEHAVVSLTDKGALGSKIAELGVPVYSLGLRRQIPNPFRALSVISLARRLRPQLIQGWMPHGNLMASVAGAVSRGHVPVLWNVRMSLYSLATEPWLTGAAIRLGALLSRHPAAIIYNSETGARQHEAIGYNAAKKVIIPNGFDSKVFHPDDGARGQVRAELGVGSETILVGLIARYHPMKDHASFLKAAGLVAQTHPEVRFLLAGIGVTKDQPALWNLVAEQRLQNRAFLLGERLDMPRLTTALDIACSASAWGEGFSNSIGEAMTCGVPCVVTDIGDSAQIVSNTGLSVPPRDRQALAQALRDLIEAGPARRQQLGAAARRRVESEFSLPAIVRRYEDLYRKHLELSKGRNIQ
jgi:glycosyltransferase involved in cell wall biosynthesis